MENEQKIDGLVAKLANSGDGCAVSDALKQCLSLLYATQPKVAERMVESIDGQMTFNNYLTEDEAKNIVSKFVNEDGSKGAKWTDNEVFTTIESLEGQSEVEPYYNKWSMYATINMMASDYDSVISKVAEGDAAKYALFAYELSAARLRDVDNPHFVRTYFDI